MKKNSVRWLTILFFLGTILFFAIDYFNVFSYIGFNIDNINVDVLSIVVGNGIVVYLFLVAYKLLDKRNIEKEKNKRKTALLMLKNTYEHCLEMIQLFSSCKEAREKVAQKCNFNNVIFQDEMHEFMRNLPFQENNETILAFAQEGVLDSNEIENYFDIKKTYQTVITEMIIFFESENRNQWSNEAIEILRKLDASIAKVHKELSVNSHK